MNRIRQGEQFLEGYFQKINYGYKNSYQDADDLIIMIRIELKTYKTINSLGDEGNMSRFYEKWVDPKKKIKS